MTADMHTHSEHSHDSKCPISDMAAMQRARGTEIFAVTDHCDIEYCQSLELDRIILSSVLDAERANREETGIEILRGVEICEWTWNEQAAKRIVSLHEYDVILGSVHAVQYEGYTMPYSQIDFAEMGREKSGEFFDAYLDDMLFMLERAELDVLAHLTCPLRYMNGKYKLGIDCRRYTEKIKKVLEKIISREIALEVNTSCLDSPYDEFMPEEWIIAMYKELGGSLLTLGSDAHTSENASHGFERAKQMLKKNGFDSLCYYKNRQPYKYAI